MADAAREMQAATEQPPAQEPIIRITTRTDLGYEVHLNLPASAVRALLDPEVADAYIEVPIPPEVRSVKKRYRHTSRIAEIDIHDDLPPVSE